MNVRGPPTVASAAENMSRYTVLLAVGSAEKAGTGGTRGFLMGAPQGPYGAPPAAPVCTAAVTRVGPTFLPPCGLPTCGVGCEVASPSGPDAPMSEPTGSFLFRCRHRGPRWRRRKLPISGSRPLPPHIHCLVRRIPSWHHQLQRSEAPRRHQRWALSTRPYHRYHFSDVVPSSRIKLHQVRVTASLIYSIGSMQ